MLYWLRTILLFPVLAIQALRARKHALILPEPTGSRDGETGDGPLLRLLICGDSAAAGVGADRQDIALLGQLVSALSAQRKVRWRLEARSGATTRATLTYLRKIDADHVDVAATSLGVNDITSGAGLKRWLEEQRQLRQVLRERFGARLIVVAGMPPVHLFPALGQPLRWHLGLRAREFSAALEMQLAEEQDCRFVHLSVSDDANDMAADGFHPGPRIYSLWANEIAKIVHAYEPLQRP